MSRAERQARRGLQNVMWRAAALGGLRHLGRASRISQDRWSDRIEIVQASERRCMSKQIRRRITASEMSISVT